VVVGGGHMRRRGSGFSAKKKKKKNFVEKYRMKEERKKIRDALYAVLLLLLLLLPYHTAIRYTLTFSWGIQTGQHIIDAHRQKFPISGDNRYKRTCVFTAGSRSYRCKL
jgi:ABC-type Fe3+ transport system permease subunit